MAKNKTDLSWGKVQSIFVKSVPRSVGKYWGEGMPRLNDDELLLLLQKVYKEGIQDGQKISVEKISSFLQHVANAE